MKKIKRVLAAVLLCCAVVFAYTLGPGIQQTDAVLTWRGAQGGLSAIDIAPDGSSFAAVSDSGELFRGQLLRDAQGQLTGVDASDPALLLDPRGTPLREGGADSEGVSLLPNSVLVSYELPRRVWEHAWDGSKLHTVPYAANFLGQMNNRGLEALAQHPDGDIVVLTETFSGRAPFQRFDGEVWHSLPDWRTRPGYAPVGADFGPEGQLFVLERAFLGVGFAARVRRMDWPGGDIRTVLTVPLFLAGNLEGIAVSATQSGLRLSLISDDNLHPWLQRSELREYVISQ